MSMKEYQYAVETMNRYPELMDFVGPRSDNLIILAEKALDIRFPATYRRFLSEYGAGAFGSDEIYGIIDADFANSGVPDAIWFTLQERKNWDLPNNLVAIYDADDGEIYCLDVEAIERDETPIITYQSAYPPEEQHRETIARDFGEFLLQLVQRQVNWKEGRVPEL
jgi:antitoxin YobK